MRGLVVAISCFVLACTVHRTDFVYVQLADPEPESTRLGDPPVKGYRGDPLPLRYRYRHAQGEIYVALGRESFVPSLHIEATVPIEVEADACSTVLPLSANEVNVTWSYWRPPSESCIAVGNSVELTIAFTGTGESLSLRGSVEQGGTFRYFDSL